MYPNLLFLLCTLSSLLSLPFSLVFSIFSYSCSFNELPMRPKKIHPVIVDSVIQNPLSRPTAFEFNFPEQKSSLEGERGGGDDSRGGVGGEGGLDDLRFLILIFFLGLGCNLRFLYSKEGCMKKTRRLRVGDGPREGKAARDVCVFEKGKDGDRY